jgi:hypothetical protein
MRRWWSCFGPTAQKNRCSRRGWQQLSWFVALRASGSRAYDKEVQKMLRWFKRRETSRERVVTNAAQAGDVEPVKALPEEDPGLVNARREGGVTPLHEAAANGHPKVVILLIDLGAEINARTEQGGTPLHGAALYGHEEAAALLLAFGARIDPRDNDCKTPLYMAEGKGHTGVVKLLRAQELLGRFTEP